MAKKGTRGSTNKASKISPPRKKTENLRGLHSQEIKKRWCKMSCQGTVLQIQGRKREARGKKTQGGGEIE